ncbi:MAG: DciA family protein [Rhodanobacteraceae bacterium]
MADLAARAREVDHLSQRIVPLLPTPLREHVGFAGLRHDRLLLLVESPAWATRARVEQACILAAVRSLGLAATSVMTKVVPLTAPSGNSATARQLSPRAAATIRAAASTIADPELRAAFEELANHAANSTA